MQTVVIIIHLIIVLALIGVVLLQRSEGGLGLGGGGSGGVSGFMTGRGQTNALTRATAILATVFFLTSMVLSWMATQTRAPRSILDTAAPPAATDGQTPAPGGQGPGLLEQLQRMQGGQGGQGSTGAPPAPGAPAPTAPAPDAGPAVPQSR
jgi:preprotein translocase subunit SecG